MNDTLKGRRYVEGIGRRKETSARVRIYELRKGESEFFLINGKDVGDFFDEWEVEYILKPLIVVGKKGMFGITVLVSGGGMTGWKDAIRLGLARALVKYDLKLKPILRQEGLVTRDARVVERKKAGLKKARKAPRWRKR